MPAVNDVGEPCAGEPHARFEVAGAGDGTHLAKGSKRHNPAGNRGNEDLQPYRQHGKPRQLPTLHETYVDEIRLGNLMK